MTLESGAGGRFSFGCRGWGGVMPGQRCLGKGCLPAWKRLEPAWRFSKPAGLQERKRMSFLSPLIYHVLPSHAHHAHVAKTTAFSSRQHLLGRDPRCCYKLHPCPGIPVTWPAPRERRDTGPSERHSVTPEPEANSKPDRTSPHPPVSKCSCFLMVPQEGDPALASASCISF